MRRALAVLLTLLAFPATASAATPWAGLQPVTTTTNAGTDSFGLPHADLAVNASGNSAAAWVSPGGQVLAARRAPAGDWGAPEVLFAGTSANDSVAVAIDAANDVTVLWSITAPGTNPVYSSSALAGGAFAAPQTVASGLPTNNVRPLDIAMNPSGQTVAAYTSGTTTSSPGYGTTAASAGATWTTPTQLNAAHNGGDPRVAINAAGAAVATTLQQVSAAGYEAHATMRTAGGSFDSMYDYTALSNADGQTVPVPVIDDTGRISVLSRTNAGMATPGQVIVSRSAGGAFTVPTSGDTAATNCNNPSADHGGTLSIDGAGAVTAAFACNGAIKSTTRSNIGDFSPTTLTTLAATASVPQLVLDSAPDGHSLLVTGVGGTVRAYRRAKVTDLFGTGEALVDPDQTQLTLAGAGLDDAGSAVALLGLANGMSAPTPLRSSILDVQPPTVAIDGPDRGAPGDLLTFKAAGNDPFGGFVGAPTWTSSDGGSATTDPFLRTFTTAGSYAVVLTRKDLGGNTVTTSKAVVITASATASPTATASPSATPSPTASPSPSPSPSPTPTPAATKCVVPKLKGKTLSAAKKALKKAHCKLGKVKKPKHVANAKLRVKKQTKKAKKKLTAGTKVGLTLKKK